MVTIHGYFVIIYLNVIFIFDRTMTILTVRVNTDGDYADLRACVPYAIKAVGTGWDTGGSRRDRKIKRS